MRIKIMLLCLVVPYLVRAIQVNKEVVQKFATEDITTIQVSNKYGNVEYFVNKDKGNEIKVVASLLAEINEYADTFDLSVLDIIIEETNSILNIENRLVGDNSGALYSLNFAIYGPDSIDLDIVNQIGDIRLPKLKGKLNIELGYGNLSVPNIIGTPDDTAKVSLSYGKFLTDSISVARVTLLNTESSINYIGDSRLKSNLSIIKINSTNDVILHSDGDRYSINNCRYINWNSNRSIITVDSLWNNGEFVLDRGNLTINNTTENFDELNLELSSAEGHIQFKKHTGFYFNAIVNNGSLILPGEDNINVIEDIDIDTYIGDMGSPEIKSSKCTLINKQSLVKITWIQ